MELLEPRHCPSAVFSTTDADGSSVDLTLRGPGSLDVVTGPAGDIDQIVLNGTTPLSQLVGRVQGGNGSTTFRSLYEGTDVQGMGRIRLADFDLAGDAAQIDLPNGADSLVLRGVAAGHSTITGAQFDRLKVLGNAVNLAVKTTSGANDARVVSFAADARAVRLDLAAGCDRIAVAGASQDFEAIVRGAVSTFKFGRPVDMPIVRADSIEQLKIGAPAEFASQIRTRYGIGDLQAVNQPVPRVGIDREGAPPIVISGPEGLVVGRNGIVSGTGSADDPYIIAGYNIAPAPSGVAITIQNIHGPSVVIRSVGVLGGSMGILIQNSDHIRIEDSQINGAGEGIILAASHDIAIDGVQIDGTTGSAIRTALQPDNPAGEAQVRNIAIMRSSVSNTGTTAIFLYGEQNLVLDTQVEHSHGRGIIIVGPFRYTVIKGNLIEECSIEGILVFGADARIGMYRTSTVTPQNARDIWIYRNTLHNNHEDMIELWYGVGASEIAHNVIDHNLDARSNNTGHMDGVELAWGIHGVRVYDNDIGHEGGDPVRGANAILVADSYSNTIEGNRINGVPGYGIAVVYDRTDFPMPTGNVVTDNTVANAGWGPVGFINMVDATPLANLNRVGPNG